MFHSVHIPHFIDNSLTEAHLGVFYFLPILSSAAINMTEKISMELGFKFLGHMSILVYFGPCGRLISSFLRILHTAV